MSGLALQDPTLVYAALSAAGEDAGLHWAAAALAPEERAYSFGPARGGQLTLRGASLGARLPPPVLQDALEARASGQVTAWEALSLLIAPADWAVASRALCWTPASPRPEVLTRVVEVYGVPAALHRGAPEALARLAAGLPAWRQRRGTPEFVLNVLQAVDRLDALAAVSPPGDLHDERFVARGLHTLRARGATPTTSYRVVGGWLRVEGLSPTSPRPDELVLNPQSSAPLDPTLCRLLPVWSSVRVGDPAESTP